MSTHGVVQRMFLNELFNPLLIVQFHLCVHDDTTTSLNVESLFDG